MTSLAPRTLGSAVVCWLILESNVAAADAGDVELGRQFLYCGVVTMKVVEWSGLQAPDKERRSKAAYARMLIQTSTLIPKDQLNTEYRVAQDRLADELKSKVSERATNPAAVGEFLRDQYVSCQKLESEKGKDAFARGMETMGPSAPASPRQ